MRKHRTTEEEGKQTDPAQAAQQPQDEQAVEQDFAELSERIHKLTSERDDLQAQVLRAMADFQNYRRRTQAEAAQLRLFATENLVTALLPVLDNFNRTVEHLEGGVSAEAMLEGIRAVQKQLGAVLEGQNLRRIPSVGQPFDPELHEAIGTEVTSDFPEDTVAMEVEPGYKMGDKVIRPARVKVAKAA